MLAVELRQAVTAGCTLLVSFPCAVRQSCHWDDGRRVLPALHSMTLLSCIAQHSSKVV